MSNRQISRKELAKQNQKQNRKRKNLRTLLIVGITALLVYITGIYGASLAYLGDFISSGMTYLQIGSGFPVESDFSGFIQGENMGSGLAVLTDDAFTVYSPTGKNVFSYSHSLADPVISSSRNRAIIYGANGNSLKVANNHSILFQQEMDHNIIHRDISDSNRVAVTTRSDSYNGEVSVYNFDMEKRFVWYCATGFPVYSSLSDSGKMLAVSTLQTDNGLLESEIFVIDSAKCVEKFSVKNGKYPYKMEFIDDTKLLIAYGDSIVILDTESGRQLQTFDLKGENLLSLETGSAYLAIASGSYSPGAAATLKLISLADYSEKFSVTVPQSVKDLSISGSRVYALGYDNIYEYDYTGRLLNTATTGPLTKQLVTWNGTVLIDSTTITKVEKTKSR